MRTRSGEVHVLKTTAHRDANTEWADDAEVIDFAGNAFADCLAGQAAAANAVHPDVVLRVRFLSGRAWKVLRRLLDVSMHVLKEGPSRNKLDKVAGNH